MPLCVLFLLLAHLCTATPTPMMDPPDAFETEQNEEFPLVVMWVTALQKSYRLCVLVLLSLLLHRPIRGTQWDLMEGPTTFWNMS